MIKLERLILQTRPIAFIRHKSKQVTLPGFYGVPLYDAFVFFIKQINKVGLNERAKAISYNFIMAVPAACICIFTLVPYLSVAVQFKAQLLSLTDQLYPTAATHNLINNFLNDFFRTQRGGLLSFGFLLVIFYASNAMMGVIRTFDKSIYEHTRKTNFIKKRWRAIKLTVVFLGLIIGMVLLLIGQGYVFEKSMKLLHIKGAGIVWIRILRFFITITLFFYCISFIYKYAPSVKKRWHTVSPGSILATVLTVLTTVAFSYWVNHFSNYNKVYGSIGTVLILMLFIYFNSLILLIGFELNVSITFLKAAAEERRENELGNLIQKEILPKFNS